MTATQEMHDEILVLKVHLLTTMQKQWTMFQLHTLPRKLGENVYELQLPFHYVLIHHHLHEYIPLEEGKARDCI